MPKKNVDRQTRVSDADVRLAFDYFLSITRRFVYRTLIAKLRFSSDDEKALLEWAFTQVTNMSSRLLNLLREDPKQVRADGAFACVLEMLQFKKDGVQGKQVWLLGDIIRHKHGDHPTVDKYRFPLSATLRESVFRGCALMILRWYQDLTVEKEHRISNKNQQTKIEEDAEIPWFFQELAEDEAEGENIDIAISECQLPSIAEVHQAWAERHIRYQESGKTKVLFGRHRGKTLALVGKRDLRWFRERLIDPNVVSATLDAVHTLLYPNPDDISAKRRAERQQLPWKTKEGSTRSVRSHPMDLQEQKSKHTRVLLGELNLYELDKLYDELMDAQIFVKEYEAVRNDVDCFIAGGPPAFPSVQPILESEERRKILQALHNHCC